MAKLTKEQVDEKLQQAVELSEDELEQAAGGQADPADEEIIKMRVTLI